MKHETLIAHINEIQIDLEAIYAKKPYGFRDNDVLAVSNKLHHLRRRLEGIEKARATRATRKS